MIVVVIVIMMIIVVVTEVDPDVKVLVVPIRFVIAAPSSISVHPGDVVAHLSALLAVAAGVAVDSGPIGLEPAMAIFFPIPVSTSGAAEREYQTAGQRAGEYHPTPQLIVRHEFLLGPVSTTRAAPLCVLCYHSACWRTIGSRL
jgi:hypothetical protein